MRSMTGFGRNETELENYKLNIEIKSVNHRFLDINIRMPRYLLFLEDEARRIIKSRLERGRVDVFVNYTDLGKGEKNCRVDVSLAKAYLAAVAQLEETTGIVNDITMENLVRLPDVIAFEESEKNEEELKQLLEITLNAAIDQLIAAREVEGQRISRDIFYRLELLENKVQEIEGKEDIVIEEYREKLRQRLSEFLEDSEMDESRFQQEILYFIDRSNITEEIVRLKSHLKQCTKTLLGEAPSGRNMDFIIQELNREFNTIGSKSSDLDITKAVLFAKGEVEKIREQIQNIE